MSALLNAWEQTHAIATGELVIVGSLFLAAAYLAGQQREYHKNEQRNARRRAHRNQIAANQPRTTTNKGDTTP